MADSSFAYEFHGDGPTVVLFNGMFQPHKTWKPLLGDLPRKYRFLLFDLPNQPMGVKTRGDVDVGVWEERILEGLRELPIQLSDTIFAGFSGGANLAINMCMRHDIKVKGLAMISPIPPGVCNALQQLYSAQLNCLENGGVKCFAYYSTALLFNTSWFEKNARAMDVWVASFLHAYSGNEEALARIIRTTLSDVKRGLPSGAPNCKSFVISGKDEKLIPVDLIAAYANEIGAEHVVVNGGHAHIIENTKESIKALDYCLNRCLDI